MKIGYEKLRDLSNTEAVEAVEDTAEGVEDTAEAMEPANPTPTMDVNMGEDGTEVSVSAPLDNMSAQEAIEFAQQMQKPTLSEQLTELMQDRQFQQLAKVVWNGTGNSGNKPPETMAEAANQNMESQFDNEAQSVNQTGDDEKMIYDDDNTDESKDALTPEEATDLIVLIMDDIAQKYPNVTAQELASILQLVNEAAAIKPNATAADLAEHTEGNRDQIENDISAYLPE